MKDHACSARRYEPSLHYNVPSTAAVITRQKEVKITAVIVDDEPLDRELLRNLINQYCRSISVVAESATVDQAVQHITEHQPQVVFLDIRMPATSGFSLLRRFPDRSFQTIFVTGSEEHGIAAVKAGAFDYLLKPIDVDELVAAEEKLLKILDVPDRSQPTLRIFSNGEHILVNLADIICLEAEGSYVRVHLTDLPSMMISKNLKQVASELDTPFLKRVHRSYVVNVNHLLRYQISGNELILYLSNNIVAKASRKHKGLIKDIPA